MNLRNILVATDFSDNAGRALDFAVDLALSSGAKLHLVHSFVLPLDVFPYSLYLGEEVSERYERAAREGLDTLCEKTRQRGVSVDGIVRMGETHDVLPKLADELDIDLLVVGTRGNTGLRHFFLGSNAERTIRLAPCPVLAVPAAEEAP